MALVTNDERSVEQPLKMAVDLHKDILENLGRLNRLVRSNGKVAEELAVLRLVKPVAGETPLKIVNGLRSYSSVFPNQAFMWAREDEDGTMYVRSLHKNFWNISGVCTSCWDQFVTKDMINPCGKHRYCFGCVRAAFAAASRDRFVGIPECCGKTLWTNKVEYRVLDFRFLLEFKEKRWEWSKEDEYRPEDRHESDEAEKEIAAMAKAEGWRRCYGCWRWVERTDGCPYMNCICGAAFCYLCGMPDRTCTGEDGDGCGNQVDEEDMDFRNVDDYDDQLFDGELFDGGFEATDEGLYDPTFNDGNDSPITEVVQPDTTTLVDQSEDGTNEQIDEDTRPENPEIEAGQVLTTNLWLQMHEDSSERTPETGERRFSEDSGSNANGLDLGFY